MIKLPKRYGHFLYGVIQSGITTCLATAIATFGQGPLLAAAVRWLEAWLASWSLMIPVVLLIAPFIQRLTILMTREA